MAAITDPNELYEISGFPINWKLKALELQFAADLLFRETEDWLVDMQEYLEKELKEKPATFNYRPSVFSTYKMLCGFAIENLLKGILVGMHPEYIKNGVLNKKLQSHNLIQLAADANIPLTQHEKFYCSNIGEAIITSGRYPIPIKVTNEIVVNNINTRTHNTFHQLFDKLAAHIQPNDYPKKVTAKRK